MRIGAAYDKCAQKYKPPPASNNLGQTVRIEVHWEIPNFVGLLPDPGTCP